MSEVRSGRHAAGDDPFAVLGLPARPDVSDDDVRAAWRRIAAATHPDREDGGDPARFGAAATAYALLRTDFGRGEALADLGLAGGAGRVGRHSRARTRPEGSAASGGRHRARRGRNLSTVGPWLRMRLLTLPPLRGWTRPHALARRPVDGAAADGATADAGAADADRQARDRQKRQERQRPARPWPTRLRPTGPGLGGLAPMRLRLAVPPRTGRPGVLAMRIVGAAAVGVLAVAVAGWSPGAIGVLVGGLTWLLVTTGRAFPRRRPR